MTSAPAQNPSKSADAVSRRRLRQERQSRVGILRNPNTPPLPPPRRAPLMGKWMRLRSSRRPPPGGVDVLPDESAVPVASSAPAPVSTARPAVTLDGAGRVEAIDIGGLMASVDDLGQVTAPRAAFAADMRQEHPPNTLKPLAPPRQAMAPPPQTWLEGDSASPEGDDAVEMAPQARPTRRRRRRLVAFGRAVLLVLGGLALALVALSLLPIMG